MIFNLTGTLAGQICDDCVDPFFPATVVLYELGEDKDPTRCVAADPRDTFRILSEEDVQNKSEREIAKTETDVNGNYTIEDLDEKEWGGGPFEVDVRFERAPGLPDAEVDPVQIHLTCVQPLPRRGQLERPQAAFSHVLTDRTITGAGYESVSASGLFADASLLASTTTHSDPSLISGSLRLTAIGSRTTLSALLSPTGMDGFAFTIRQPPSVPVRLRTSNWLGARISTLRSKSPARDSFFFKSLRRKDERATAKTSAPAFA